MKYRKFALLWSVLCFFNLNAKIRIPQNEGEKIAIHTIIKEIKSKTNLNGSELNLITLHYSSCDLSKDNVASSINNLSQDVFVVFPVSDTIFTEQLAQKFGNRRILFNSQIYNLIEKWNYDAMQNYFIKINEDPIFLEIENAGNSNIQTFLQKKVDLKLDKSCKVPLGSFLIRYNAVSNNGLYFSDVRNRIFFLKNTDTIATEINFNALLNYDSIFNRIPNRMDKAVNTDRSKGMLREKMTILGIFPAGDKTLFHFAFNYLFEQSKDTLKFWKATLLVSIKHNSEMEVEILSGSEIDHHYKMGNTSAFRFLYPKADGHLIMGRVYTDAELQTFLLNKKNKMPLAVEFNLTPICIIDSLGNQHWKNWPSKEFESIKVLNDYNIPNTYIKQLISESADLGLIMNAVKNNHLFFYAMPHVYDIRKNKLKDLLWWNQLNDNFTGKLYLQSVTHNQLRKEYLFGFSINTGMLFATTNESFDLINLEMHHDASLSTAKIIQDQSSCVQIKDFVYKLKFQN